MAKSLCFCPVVLLRLYACAVRFRSDLRDFLNSVDSDDPDLHPRGTDFNDLAVSLTSFTILLSCCRSAASNRYFWEPRVRSPRVSRTPQLLRAYTFSRQHGGVPTHSRLGKCGSLQIRTSRFVPNIPSPRQCITSTDAFCLRFFGDALICAFEGILKTSSGVPLLCTSLCAASSFLYFRSSDEAQINPKSRNA